MAHNLSTSVDEYFESVLIPKDLLLELTLKRSNEAGLPSHAVSPTQGMFLNILAKSIRAVRILEIGTLGGYSTIWLARALPDSGQLVTLELDAAAAEVAQTNIHSANLHDKVEIMVGPATQSLNQLISKSVEPFDLIFIDADKPNNTLYLEKSMQLSRTGTLIIADNVVREGEVANAASNDPKVKGVREFLGAIAKNPRLTATAIQTVGTKGYDGFAIARVD